MDKAEKVFKKLAAPLPGAKMVSDAYKATKSQFDNIMASNFAKNLGLFGAGLILSQFVEEVVKALKEMGVKAKSPKYYKKMMENNPQLSDADPQEVAKLWATLYDTAPNLAKDPVAAGAFITQSINKEVMKEHAGPPIDTYKTLVDIEKGKKKDTPDTLGKFMDLFKG